MITTKTIIKSLLITAIVSISTIVSLPTDSSAMATIHCAGKPSSQVGTGPFYSAGSMQIDPIVNRGSTMSMHEHQFFGFTEWDSIGQPYNANYSDLVNKKTSCNVVTDSAAYWTPTLRYTTGSKALVPILRSEAYYRPWDGKLTDPSSQTQAFPNDLRLVAGNPSAMMPSEMNLSVVSWSCSNTSTKSTREGFKFRTPEEANCATARPIAGQANNPNAVALTVVVKFPTCWDGQLNNHTVAGNTADFVGDPSSTITQHVAYRVGNQCPVGFPVKIPELRYVSSWSYKGNGRNIQVSSGMGTGAGKGYTWHADFWNTWPEDSMQAMVSTCINTSKTDAQVHLQHRKICGMPVMMNP